MIDPALGAAFLAATLMIVVTPGPSVALATAQGLRFGPRAVRTTVAGDALGSAVHVLIATLGLRWLIGMSDALLPWLQIGGGLYLLWLGIQSLRAPAHDADAPPPSQRASFWTGFGTCVTNPKAIVFFLTLFPAFISPLHPVWVQSLVYGAVFIALDALFIFTYATLARHGVARLGGAGRITHLSGLGLSAVGGWLCLRGARALG